MNIHSLVEEAKLDLISFTEDFIEIRLGNTIMSIPYFLIEEELRKKLLTPPVNFWNWNIK